MKASIFIFALLLIFSHAAANEQRRLLREGNRLFEEGDYIQAGEKFRQALAEDSSNTRAMFNLGNALYRQGRLQEAAEIFEALSQIGGDDSIRADALHNLGNSQLGAGQIGESIESYKESLRLNPEDDDTRYNLAYAMNLLQEEPPEEGAAPPDEDSPGGDDQGESPPDAEEDAEQPAQEQPDPAAGESGVTAQRPEQLSKEDAERILDALNRMEQRVQEQVERKPDTVPAVRPRRNW